MNIPTIDEVLKFTEQVGGYYRRESIIALYHEACRVPPEGLMVEIGVYGGRSASVLLQVARATGALVVLMDPWVWMEGTGAPEFKKTIANFGDVQYMVWKHSSVKAAPYLGDPIDLLHIDGDHQLDGVVKDCELWLPKVKPGGSVCFHDYGNPGLPGVKEAVDKCLPHGWERVGVYDTLLVVRKPEGGGQ